MFLCHISIIVLLPLSSTPEPGPSFQSPVSPAPVPVNVYIQGSPILTLNDQYFTIPQVSGVYIVITSFVFELF